MTATNDDGGTPPSPKNEDEKEEKIDDKKEDPKDDKKDDSKEDTKEDTKADPKEDPKEDGSGDQKDKIVKKMEEEVEDGKGDGNEDKIPPRKAKRMADVQLNKDDHPEGGEIDDEGIRAGPFSRATDSVLKGRKIYKLNRSGDGGATPAAAARRESGGTPAKDGTPKKNGENNSEKDESATKETEATKGEIKEQEDTETTKSANPFEGVNFAEKSPSNKATFGSAPAFGFGTATKGFGSVTASAGDFTSKIPLSGFGSSTTGTSGFGSTATASPAMSNGFGFGVSTSTTKTAGTDSSENGGGFGTGTPSSLPPTSPTAVLIRKGKSEGNGEEQEEVDYEVRAKLYHLDVVKQEEQVEKVVGENVPSVPSASGRMELIKKEGENDGATDVEPVEDKNNKATEKFEWKEKGTGPVRILVKQVNGKSHARVVHRMEKEKCGKGHRVILNVTLDAYSKASRESENDKFIRLTTLLPQTGKDAVVGKFSFKVKTTAEANAFEEKLKKLIPSP